jgi:hypothetical protein
MSKTTKPSGVPIIPADSAIVRQEVAYVDEDGQFTFVQRWTEHFNWFPKVVPPEFSALMIFRQPGRLLICDWNEKGPTIISCYQELVEQADARSLRALRLIQDRYGKLVFKKERRASLGAPALAHLGLERGVKSKIYLATFPEWLEILSADYRNTALVEFDDRLENLPFFEF